MNWYLKLKERLSVLSYFSLFLFIAILMFGFFYLQIARPLCKLKERQNNTEVSWEEIKSGIVKVNFGDSPTRVKELLGDPDATFSTPTKEVFSYQRYGLYQPKYYYDVEFRKDTLFEITNHD